MPRLPQVSGNDVIRLLQSIGYEVIRQRGSHIRLEKAAVSGKHGITVPAHKVVAKGTLSDIIDRISLWNNIPKEDLIRRLKHK